MKSADYRPDIDGLRAIAVVAVVIFHAFPAALPGGFVGVDVFFVISGYLITGIIAKNLDRGSFSLIDFYGRRARRIFPALIVVLLSTALAGWFLFLPEELSALGTQIIAAVGFVSNFALWREAGYFDDVSLQKPLLHLWSLAIEEQFYLIWPCVLIAAAKYRLSLIVTIALCFASSFALGYFLLSSDPVAGFYFPLARFWELLVGAALSQLKLTKNSTALSAIGLSAIGSATLVFTEDMVFPGLAAIVPTLGAALVIAGGSGALPNRMVLSNPAVVFIGLISYPLYLWHWPLLSIPHIVEGGASSILIRIATVVAAVMLSIGTYRFIELPLRHGSLRKAFGITLAMSAPLAIGGLFALSAGLPGRPNISPYLGASEKLTADIAWQYSENDLCLSHFPFEGRREGWSFCMLEKDAPPTLFLIGNSFANHLYPGLVAQERLSNQNILQFGTCYPLIGVSFSAYTRGHPCAGTNADAQARFVSTIIEENPSVRFAIINAPWPAFDDDGRAVAYNDTTREDGVFQSVPPIEGESSYDAFMGGLERRISQLISRGVTPILFLATPQLPYSPEACVAIRPLQPATQTCEISAQNEISLHRRFRAGIRAMQQTQPELLVFDPTSTFCDERVCRMSSASAIWLRDEGHLSVAGSAKLAGDFLLWAKSNSPNLLN